MRIKNKVINFRLCLICLIILGCTSNMKKMPSLKKVDSIGKIAICKSEDGNLIFRNLSSFKNQSISDENCKTGTEIFYIVTKDKLEIFGSKISYRGSVKDFHLLTFFSKIIEDDQQIFDFAVSKKECTLTDENNLYIEYQKFGGSYRQFWVKDGQCFLKDRKPNNER